MISSSSSPRTMFLKAYALPRHACSAIVSRNPKEVLQLFGRVAVMSYKWCSRAGLMVFRPFSSFT